jgi:hypothetical protein
MIVMNKIVKNLVVILVLLLAGCGTFEIGIESNTVPEVTIDTVGAPIETIEKPIETVPSTIEAEPTIQLTQSDEQAISAALAEKLGISIEEVPFAITQNTGTHAKGGIDNGYFLAFKQDGNWVIVYDGQANPPCADVEQYQFPTVMVPECLDANYELVIRSGNVSPPASSPMSLECGPGSSGASPGSADYVACNIQDGLWSRNISALLGYMEDPFTIGYWQSEGVQYTPQDFLILLPQLYNFNDPDYTPRLTFTTDRSQFPDLQGMPVEGIFGPDVNLVEVIYSQGWGAEGDQGTLIYLTQDPAGNYKWYGMLVGIR